MFIDYVVFFLKMFTFPVHFSMGGIVFVLLSGQVFPADTLSVMILAANCSPGL